MCSSFNFWQGTCNQSQSVGRKVGLAREKNSLQGDYEVTVLSAHFDNQKIHENTQEIRRKTAHRHHHYQRVSRFDKACVVS